jgi:RNA polymerase-binding transcription factor DksA
MLKVTQIKSLPPPGQHRTDTLKQGLLDRQRALRNDVHNRRLQDDLARALLQMQSESLVGIDAALARLDAGGYGLCVECQREIATRRLLAVPFAVRCEACEEKIDEAQGDAHRLAHGRGRLVRFPEMAKA